MTTFASLADPTWSPPARRRPCAFRCRQCRRIRGRAPRGSVAQRQHDQRTLLDAALGAVEVLVVETYTICARCAGEGLWPLKTQSTVSFIIILFLLCVGLYLTLNAQRLGAPDQTSVDWHPASVLIYRDHGGRKALVDAAGLGAAQELRVPPRPHKALGSKVRWWVSSLA